MKKIALILGFVLIFLTLFVRADTTFFDNQDDFFIMGEIPEGGSIQQAGGGSSGIPEEKDQIKDTEESPEEDELDGMNFFRQLIFTAFFFLATFFVLHTQKIIFRILRI